MTGRYEAELDRIRAMEDWQIPKAALATPTETDPHEWKRGRAAEAARGR